MGKCIYTVLLTAVTLTLHAADRNASVTLNANAKYHYTEGDDPQVLSWQFSNQTTEQIITPTSTPQSQHIYYNLNGQQVEAPVKGIYIRQGKKIVIR